jgi:hypothetical protein
MRGAQEPKDTPKKNQRTSIATYFAGWYEDWKE